MNPHPDRYAPHANLRLTRAMDIVIARQKAEMDAHYATWNGLGEGRPWHRLLALSGDELVRQAKLAGVQTNWEPGKFYTLTQGHLQDRPYFADQQNRRWMLDGSGDVA